MKKIIKKLALIAAAFVIATCLCLSTTFPARAEAVKTETNAEITENVGDTVTDGEILNEVENDEKTGEEITRDDLLALAGSVAKEEGPGDEWEQTMEALRLAVSEKKLDVAIVLDVIKLAVIVAYVSGKTIGKIIKSRKEKKNPSTIPQDVAEVKTTTRAQTKAVNALIEEEKHVGEAVEKENAKLSALAQAQIGTNTALRCIIRGAQIKTELKDEALRALNNSDESCDAAQR